MEPICISDIEAIAKTKLSADAWQYYTMGADSEQTLSENRNAFDRLRIRPRLLRGIQEVDTTCYIQKQKIALPICVAPTGLHKLAHADGEIGTAKGIENAGYQAIVLTVDTATRKLNKYQKMRDLLASKNERIYTEVLTDDAVKVAVSWSDVDWLRTVTKLPILLKGILTREDALEALKHDVQGIIVSNHGGRQLDGVSSTIEALPEIVHAVNGKMDVYLDGGIRKGTDVFKALALGAKAVFFGRPAIYGLAYNGKEGVEKVFQMLKDEFERAMLLAGCASLADITPDMVVHESYYWKLPNHKL
ncbi:2-Hydroxyacid oxidase 2-like isoform X2 [Hydractinia symbiolongicarpus]|uniref:2-Hydroxyacid oxidase 2-like isoform X2 n=1 Tax=Hydractinia symbiolongicarpus TaxID=13093 RepID=UPI00254F7CCD|nr:2-Hydroxyacid oxidase 2-like isoform X2 [Hydractinia symbiolongicarpus]